jgi:hypothetical protein
MGKGLQLTVLLLVFSRQNSSFNLNYRLSFIKFGLILSSLQRDIKGYDDVVFYLLFTYSFPITLKGCLDARNTVKI